MYELLKQGMKIIVSLEGCLSTVFWIEDNKLHCYNRSLEEFIHLDGSEEWWNNHVQRMISSMIPNGGGLTIRTYKSKREMFKEIDKLNITEGDE